MRELLDAVRTARAAEKPTVEDVTAIAHQFVAATQTGGLTLLADSDLESLTAACRDLAEGRFSSVGHAYLGYYIAWQWESSGRIERAVRVLESLQSRFPKEAYAEQKRGQLLASLYRKLGRTGSALALLRTLEAKCGPDAALDLAAIHGERCDIELERGLLDEAARHLAAARDALEGQDDAEALYAFSMREAEFLCATGEFAQALRVVDESLARLGDPEARSDAPDVARLLVYRGVAEFGLEQGYDVAERAWSTLTDALSKKTLDRTLRRFAQHKLVEIAMRRGDADAAQHWLAACRDTTSSSFLRALEARFAVELGGEDAALERAREALLSAYRDLLAEWRAQPLRDGGTGFLLIDDRRVVLDQLITTEMELGKRGEVDRHAIALQHVLDAQALSTLTRLRKAPTCTVADVQREWLTEGGGALVYLPGKWRTHLFVVERDGLQHYELPSRVELLPPVRRLADDLAIPPASAGNDEQVEARLGAQSEDVRDVLIPEDVLGRVVDWSSCTVVGADLVWHLPFATLRLDSGELLGERVPLIDIGSLPLGVALKRQTKPSGDPLSLSLIGCTRTRAPRAVAQGVVQIDFPRDDALEGILDAYGERARSVFDAGATRAALLKRDWTASDVTHLLAHSVRDWERELGHGLAFADASVWYDDVLDLDVRGLVIVSACASGMSASREGDGELVTNLGGALLRSGAHAIVQSKAPLEVHRHLVLMEAFHRELAAGKSPAAALQSARRARRTDGWRDRFYRAQLQVYGLGQQPLRAR